MSQQGHVSEPQLRWRCRRGMLELDILLSNFLEMEYNQLSQEDISVFLLLLDYSDQKLLDLLLGKIEASDVKISKIVQKIRYACHDSIAHELRA